MPYDLTFNDTPIKDKNDMLCLTDMWKAAGGKNGQRPANWARKEGADFIAKIADNVPVGHIIEQRRGRNGGTWAHWQIGMAYAKYLSAEFHAWCNEVVRAHMEGTTPPAPQDARWLTVRQEAKEVRNFYTGTLSDHGVRQPRDFARATNAVYTQLFGGPAHRLRQRLGLPKKGNVRDSLSRMELAQLTLSEELAIEHIEDERSWGADECIDVSAMAARSVSNAVRDNRAQRRQIGRV